MEMAILTPENMACKKSHNGLDPKDSANDDRRAQHLKTAAQVSVFVLFVQVKQVN
jgi:hypothetical protein